MFFASNIQTLHFSYRWTIFPACCESEESSSTLHRFIFMFKKKHKRLNWFDLFFFFFFSVPVAWTRKEMKYLCWCTQWCGLKWNVLIIYQHHKHVLFCFVFLRDSTVYIFWVFKLFPLYSTCVISYLCSIFWLALTR